MPIEPPDSVRVGSIHPDFGIVKRSLVIAGHRTSISLEEAFWRELKALAKRRMQSINALVAEIDANRGRANLSSAIRVFLFESALQ
jgi:predicted DNA-binding ribbon-helix-helix protein